MLASRSEAIEAVEEWYYTGKPCKHGHLSKRLTVDGSCYQCRIDLRSNEASSFREKLAAKKAAENSIV